MTHVSPPPATPLKLNPSAILTLNSGAYPDEREVVSGWSAIFPNLGDDYGVLGKSNPVYNCIAWTVDETGKWEWKWTMRDFDDLYASVGLKRAEHVDTRLEAGVRKVVLYGKLNPDGLKLTHGAKQEEDGTWTSKLGKGPLIRHRTAEQVSGSEYGDPVAVYVGKR